MPLNSVAKGILVVHISSGSVLQLQLSNVTSIATRLRETTQVVQSSLDVNHAALSIRCAPVLVLSFQPIRFEHECIVLHGGGQPNKKIMKTEKLAKADLVEFTGTGHWYRHPMVKNITYTDGIKYVAERAGIYWLIDEIAFQQIHPLVRNEEFQVWTLEVNLAGSTAILTWRASKSVGQLIL